MTCLGIHDPTYDENGPELSRGSHLTTCTLWHFFTLHFLAHGFPASYKHLSCLSFQLSSYAIVIDLLDPFLAL